MEPNTGRDEVSLAALPVVLLGSVMVVLDFFIVNVAVPSLRDDLGASAAAVQFVVAGYGVAYGSGLILAARLGDRFGRRRIYLLGFALFTVASAACGLAPGADVLIVARVVQGWGAALLSPQVLALIGELYREPSRRAHAFTGYGIALGLGAVSGQLIGGALIEADVAGLGWRACFLVNIPIGLVAVPLTRRIVPESRGRGGGLDIVGAVTVTAAVVALVLPLIAGRELGWPVWSILLLVASVPLSAGFVAQQRRRARRGDPLVDLTVFRQPGVGTGIGTVLLFYGGNASFFLVLAVYLQDALGLSPLASGVLFVAIGTGFLTTSLLSGRVVRAVGDLAIAGGAAGMVVGLAALVWAGGQDLAPTARIASVAAATAVYGAGQGLVMAPLNASVLARVPARLAGTGAGLVTTMMQVGNALGVAVIGLVFFSGSGATLPARFGHATMLLIAVDVAVVALVAVRHVRDRSGHAAAAHPAGARQPTGTRAT